MATIPEYYQDKIIFVTGATGFIGKVLVEKLLRSCPQLQAIYCLTRSKQGEAASDRLSRMLSEPVGFIMCCCNPFRYRVNLQCIRSSVESGKSADLCSEFVVSLSVLSCLICIK